MDRETLIGQNVINKAFGRGTIIDYDGKHIKVEFKTKTSDFLCPKAFLDGFLSAENLELHDALINEASDVLEKEQQEKEAKRTEEERKREEERKNRGVRGEHKDTVMKGETFGTHADALNACFGYKYKHFQKAFKEIDEEYGAWFPSIAKRVMGEYLAADTGNGWLNILCENDTVILEKNVEDPNMNVTREKAGKRFVFAKFDGSDVYTFVGLFSSDPVPTENGFRYERLGTEIDLKTMEVIK